MEHALDEADKACDRALTLTDNPYQWEAVLAEAACAPNAPTGSRPRTKPGWNRPFGRLEPLRAPSGLR